MPDTTPPEPSETDSQIVRRFVHQFATFASIQGRLAYFLMSIHVIHPHIVSRFLGNSATRVLYVNMVYGIGAMIFDRPFLKPIAVINRVLFSLLGSLSFNYGSMAVFNWLSDTYKECTPVSATILTFLAGRVMMLHLLAFLYHVDISSDSSVPRSSTFDVMYR